jgi:hypothetical protein
MPNLRRVSNVTAKMISNPRIVLSKVAGTRISTMEFGITPIRIAPKKVPTGLPIPPNILVPPITAAPIALNSNP